MNSRPVWVGDRRASEQQIKTFDDTTQDFIRSTAAMAGAYRYSLACVATAVVEWRVREDITLKQAAAILGTTKGYVSDIERRRIEPGPAFLINLMEAITTGCQQPRLRKNGRTKGRLPK